MSKFEHKDKPSTVIFTKKSSSLSEPEMLERLKMFGGPLIKSLKGDSQSFFINLLFSLSKENIIKCLEFYGGDFAEALKVYDSEACKLFIKNLHASLPKDDVNKILKNIYGGKLTEALAEKPSAQCSFIALLFGTDDSDSDHSASGPSSVSTSSGELSTLGSESPLIATPEHTA